VCTIAKRISPRGGGCFATPAMALAACPFQSSTTSWAWPLRLRDKIKQVASKIPKTRNVAGVRFFRQSGVDSKCDVVAIVCPIGNLLTFVYVAIVRVTGLAYTLLIYKTPDRSAVT